MDKDQVLTDLKEAMEDVFQSIEKIKGEKFADAVRYLHMSMHTFRLITIFIDKETPKEATKMLSAQYAGMVDYGLEAVARGLSEEDMKEVWKWAEQLDKRVDSAMKELNK